ncbi:MAG: hypothetical protein WAS55_13010 [Saprospiraceae bacterium]|nr:CcoQ/FixQ family Cbb3-type cytochrome c oxidase assembly chaperone [Saprospiraceae bacterium]MBK8482871.1 CcoQ/FixQ family Cbb3-type cytochrome c oxidase assembly chaperone [Saprospiraceae bacterium]MBK9726672.1 CcoQ/FixQ family Cbb3-type cytochrome c oxidase assembly chaperone [Saprospiraceae bacterium]
MKFNNYLEKIAGVEIYPLISLLLFVVFFVAVTIWAFKANDGMIKRMENLPLDNKEN